MMTIEPGARSGTNFKAPPAPVLCGPERTARSSRATGCERCGAVIYHDPHRRDARPLVCLPCGTGAPRLAS